MSFPGFGPHSPPRPSLVVSSTGLSHLVEPAPQPIRTVRSARFSIAIGRHLGTVVVTVHGEVDAPAAAHLGAILADLIDGQGNLCLVVDLADATAADGGSLPVFAVAAERARERGGVLTLSHARSGLLESLREAGLGELIALPFDSGGRRHPEAAPNAASQRGRSAHPAGARIDPRTVGGTGPAMTASGGTTRSSDTDATMAGFFPLGLDERQDAWAEMPTLFFAADEERR